MLKNDRINLSVCYGTVKLKRSAKKYYNCYNANVNDENIAYYIHV